jgi:hypothetical protein
MWSVDHEDVVVRQYRYLLRTAPGDAIEHAHVEALEGLDENSRAAILRAVQSGLVAGMRLTPQQVAPLAHLIALGERRRPGAFLGVCDERALRALAELVVVAEASFGLFGGYAAWDGAEPGTDEAGWVDGGFGERWHDALVGKSTHRNLGGGLAPPDASLGGGY